jgi:hypothetical protein
MKFKVESKEYSDSDKMLTTKYVSPKGDELVCIQKSPYSLRAPKEGRPKDFWDKQTYEINYQGKDIKISGPGRREVISLAGIENKNILTMDGTVSNADLDRFLAKQALPEKTTKSIFIYNKQQKSEDELDLEKHFLYTAFDQDSLTQLKLGKDIIIPVRRNNRYDERSGHWINVRLTYSEGLITPVLENSTNEIANKKLSDIKEDYEGTIISSISEYLHEVGFQHEMKSMEYCENRQYGNMGCGITAIDNIKNNLSKIEAIHLKESDQKIETTQVLIFHDEETNQDVYDNSQKVTLQPEAEMKITKGDVLNEGILRVEIASTLASINSENINALELELMDLYEGKNFIVDVNITPENIDTIEANTDETDEDFAKRFQDAEIRLR